MIVGGYTLHLYCRNVLPIHYPQDGPRPAGYHTYERDRGEFYGRNEREAMKEARKAGWTFRNGDTACPACSTRKAPTS